VLDGFATHRRSGDNARAASWLSKDAEWTTLYEDTIKGKDEIQKWLEEEVQHGRRNVEEGQWIPAFAGSVDSFKRDLTVHFPNGSTHQVIQKVSLQGRRISKIRVEPVHEAHRVVLTFALARKRGDDEAAIRLMSDDVLWRTFDDFSIKGKQEVRQLLQKQRQRQEKRVGMSDFEAIPPITEKGGEFSRKMQIERPDGVKIRTAQTLKVAMAKGVLRITQIHVHSEEMLRDGQWVECPASPKRSPLSQTLMKGLSGLMPKKA